ncbi:MAG: hypothetical protein ACREXT_16120, partial [Gammaproteobacteria bacterium]
MQNSLLAGAMALAFLSPLAGAETTSSQTTTTTIEPSTEYSSSRTEQQVDADGNVIKKTETYKSEDPVTGDSSSSSSTSVETPEGAKSTVEQERTIDG